jgi:tripartite-type tricarboxylate transporter receptor subunit TctC
MIPVPSYRFSRRHALLLGLFMGQTRFVMAQTAGPAQAPAWPVRPVRIIVPFAAGGPVEVPARGIAEYLSQRLGQPFIVETRPGAGGALGVQLTVQSTDQHTLVLTTGSVGILPALQKNPGFDPIRDLNAISLVSESALAFNVRAESRLTNLAELIRQAKASPGRISFGSSGVGTTSHLVGELLKDRAKIDLLHVPFRGTGQGLASLLNGDVDILVTDASVPVPHVREGRLRVLGVTTEARVASLPEVPAVAEILPGFVMPLWFGLFGPNHLPPGVPQRLAQELEPLRVGSDLARRMEAGGSRLLLSGPESLAARVVTEVPMWRDIVLAAGITPE